MGGRLTRIILYMAENNILFDGTRSKGHRKNQMKSIDYTRGQGGGGKFFFGSKFRARLQVDVATFDVFGKELFSRSSANNRQSSQKDPSLVPIEMYRSNVTH